MCAVGFGGQLPVTSFGWQGENASPSLQRRTDLPAGSLQFRTDYLLNAKFSLSDEFEELEVESRVPIASVKLFLTDSEIVVAKISEDILGGTKSSVHLRTHNIKSVEIDVDPLDSNTISINTGIPGQRFLYRIRRGAAGVSMWMNRVFRLRRNSVSPSSATVSTIEEREDQKSYSLVPANPLSDTCIRQPSHTKDPADNPLDNLSQLPNGYAPTSILCASKYGSNDNSKSPGVSSPLRRRKAFRNSTLESFRSGSDTRSSSAPPDDKQNDEDTNDMLTTSLVFSSNDTDKKKNLSIPFESSSKSPVIRKGKLKISPLRAKKFTRRALSARLGQSPVDDNSEEKQAELRRVRSLNNSSSTLPRLLRKKDSKLRHSIVDSACTSPAAVSTPGTPTRTPKSPGSILKLFHRKSGTSSLNFEEFITSMEEQDLSTVDVNNKPNQLKLYLLPPKQLAEELTLIDAEFFRNIEISELQNGAWTKKTKHSTSPNILKMIDSFNRLARIVCTEIVHEKTVACRAKAITNYIQIANKLFKIHNYNSMKAIISGLQSQAIYRLERTWNQVSTRRRRKFQRLSNFLTDMDSVDYFKKRMQSNLENKVQCVPYLGWLLTYTLHYQTYKKLQEESELAPLHHNRTSTSSPKKSLQASICSLSLPASPLQSDEEEEPELRSVITNFSVEVLRFTKSLSDTNVQSYAENSPTNLDTSSSPREEVDFDFPLEDNQFHPLAANVIVNPITYSTLKSDDRSSSDSSVEDSIQTDSAIGLDSSTGQPSPAHKRQNGVVKPTRTIQFSKYVKEKLHSESLPNIPPCFYTGEYILSPVNYALEDDDDASDIEDRRSNVFGSSCYTGPSVSSSRSSSVLSPSMITFSLTSEPTTPRRRMHHQSRLLSVRQHQNDADPLDDTCSSGRGSSVLSIPGCGILFSSCRSSVDRVDLLYHIPYCQPGMPFDEIVKQVKAFFDDCCEMTDLVKNSTPLNSMTNITDCQPSANSESDQDSSNSSSGHANPMANENDSVLREYQENTLNYSSELTSRDYMRSLINNVPWLDENQCHLVSMEVEPS